MNVVPARRGLFALLLLATILLSACGTTSATQRAGARGFLRFEIEPPTAAVEIDEEYSGLVSGWVQQTIPVEPGVRRVTVRADGYLTQRFDIEVDAGTEVTLVLNMERALTLDQPEPSTPTFRERVRRDE